MGPTLDEMGHTTCIIFTCQLFCQIQQKYQSNILYNMTHAESEKVLNVPSILRVTVLMFFNVEQLGGDVFRCEIC